MKKLFEWLWDIKQNEEVEKRNEEVKLIKIKKHQMVDEKARAYNKKHGLPLDQLVGK